MFLGWTFNSAWVVHCDETRVQVLKEAGREPSSQSWMWVRTGAPPGHPVVLFDYTTSRAQEVPLHLFDGYRGYLMTDNGLAARSGIERLAAGRMLGASSSKRRRYSPRARPGVPMSRST